MGTVNCTMPVESAPPMFASDLKYYMGVWRRTPYDVTAWPQCLNANNGTAVCLGGFDAEVGNLWQVVRCQENAYILQCSEVGENQYLGADLRPLNLTDSHLLNSD